MLTKEQGYNPYLPAREYVPDGEPYVFDGRLYVFGSHDRFGGTSFCENDYVLWSTDVHTPTVWKYEGVIYRKGQDPLDPEGIRPLYAPDVERGADGRFYLYYSLRGGISVAVADTVTGPYEFHGHVVTPDGSRFGIGDGTPMASDPAVLLDSDGRCFLYCGYDPNTEAELASVKKHSKRYEGAFCVELNPRDMRTVIGEARIIVPGKEISAGTGYEGYEFYEASSIRRIGKTYYFIYSSKESHDLCYATSHRPDRDFVFGGRIVSIGDLGLPGVTHPRAPLGNTHGSLCCVEGDWFVFYHRQTNDSHFCRQACAESITLATDGSIAQVEVTSCGLNRAPLHGKGTYDARIACNLYNECPDAPAPYVTQSGEDDDETAEQYVTRLSNGGVVGFKYFSFDGTNQSLAVRYRGAPKGRLLVSADTPNQSPIAVLYLNETNEWRDVHANFTPPTGTHAIFFRLEGEGTAELLRFTLL